MSMKHARLCWPAVSTQLLFIELKIMCQVIRKLILKQDFVWAFKLSRVKFKMFSASLPYRF
jgi:hypothetical protein